jgi:hypothetical protein
VGQDEESFSLVRRADFRRCDECRRNSVAQFSKLVGDFSKSHAQMVGDVFEEAPSRLALSNDSSKVRPEMPLVLSAFSLSSK